MFLRKIFGACTIRWGLVCEDEVGLFYFFGGNRTDRAGLGGGCIPRRCTPAPSSAPGRTTPGRPYQMQGQTMQDTAHGAPTHTPGRWTRCGGLHSIPDCPRRADRNGAGRWRADNTSIMRIMIALSQAWYIDSNMNKYHKDILSFLVIVNYYLSIDILSY